MAHLSLGESSKPQSSQKAHLLGELGPQRRGNEATSGNNAKARRYSREIS